MPLYVITQFQFLAVDKSSGTEFLESNGAALYVYMESGKLLGHAR